VRQRARADRAGALVHWCTGGALVALLVPVDVRGYAGMHASQRSRPDAARSVASLALDGAFCSAETALALARSLGWPACCTVAHSGKPGPSGLGTAADWRLSAEEATALASMLSRFAPLAFQSCFPNHYYQSEAAPVEAPAHCLPAAAARAPLPPPPLCVPLPWAAQASAATPEAQGGQSSLLRAHTPSTTSPQHKMSASDDLHDDEVLASLTALAAAATRAQTGAHGDAPRFLCCQIRGCCEDLTHGTPYMRRTRLCTPHARADFVLDPCGAPLRFCQKCNRAPQTD